MKRFNLTAYGFERVPDKDFTDDGTRFTAYLYRGFRVTVAHYEDDVYISASSCKEGEYLPYEIYSKLPNYQDLDILNGVKKDSVEPIAIEALKLTIKDYEKAYMQAYNEYKTKNN